MFDRATPKVSHTAVIANCPSATTVSATAVFWAGGDLKRFLEDFAFHRLLAEEALQLLHLVLKRPVFGCRDDFLLRCRGQLELMDNPDYKDAILEP